MVELTDRVARCDLTTVEGGGKDNLILNLDNGEYFTVGEVGGFIWEQLDGVRDLAAIVAEVVANFQVDRERAAADVLAFAEQVLEHSLAELRPGR